ncbi:hypothetical protein DRO97_09215, partial [Archaeoglobales archaeon]
MDVKAKKTLLWDAFEELKNKWSLDERMLEKLETEEPTINGLPESKVKDLYEIKSKYQLDDIDFLFIVGAAVGFYSGKKNVREVINKKINEVND